jgi:hypothetical protein
VANGRRADFETVFGPGGIWTKLLHQSDGYLLTEIRCESPESRQYRVRDFWEWHRSFENFRSRFQSEYERFGSWILSDGLIEKERFLGAYYEEINGGENDSVLI